jgi:hypothetical protein
MKSIVTRHKEEIGRASSDPRCALVERVLGAIFAGLVVGGVCPCRKVEDELGVSIMYADDIMTLAHMSSEEMMRLKSRIEGVEGNYRVT